MKARAYVGGSPIELPNACNSCSAVLEIELEDGRTVQLTVDNNGGIRLRAWGNIPAKIGNWNRTGFEANVQFEEQDTDPTTGARLTQ